MIMTNEKKHSNNINDWKHFFKLTLLLSIDSTSILTIQQNLLFSKHLYMSKKKSQDNNYHVFSRTTVYIEQTYFQYKFETKTQREKKMHFIF